MVLPEVRSALKYLSVHLSVMLNKKIRTSTFLQALFLLSSLSLLVISCASVKSPPGGPKDTTPPQLDPLRSTRNLQTNFTETSIKLFFDEWITTGDAFSQIVVSPPLQYPYKIDSKGKSVLFSFDAKEVLKSNATYTINFGDYIKDYTAGNVVENLRFLFSTGDVIDSLSLKGQLIHANSLKPVAKVLVMLYEDFADSIVYSHKPFYFGRTDENGNFRIDNIRSGTFKLFALNDQNGNYLYDLPTEEIGFQDSLIIFEKNRNVALAAPLTLFTELPKLKLNTTNFKTRGILRHQFSTTPHDLSYRAFPPFVRDVSLLKNDSLLIYYLPDTAGDGSQKLVFYDSYQQATDTVTFQLTDIPSDILSSLHTPIKPGGDKIHPQSPYQIVFNRPLKSIDQNRFIWFVDTLQQAQPPKAHIDSLSPFSVFLKNDWKENTRYRFLMLPGACTDIFDKQNDSLDFTFLVDEKAAFGNLIIRLAEIPDAPAYIFTLYDNAGKEIDVRYSNRNNEQILSFNALKPGNYSLEIVLDLNGNKRWDTGNYSEKLQPEPLFRQQIQQIRANWDLEIDVNWKR